LLNKPKFHLIKNTKYALDGLVDIIQYETSFKIELLLFIVVSFIIFFIDFGFGYVSKSILFLSMFLPMIAEIINSAIERVVDLNTLEFHPIAKKAKDIGSLIVLINFLFMFLIWGFVIYYEIAIK
jgi:diacylglycerol kinase (ATP)